MKNKIVLMFVLFSLGVLLAQNAFAGAVDLVYPVSHQWTAKTNATLNFTYNHSGAGEYALCRLGINGTLSNLTNVSANNNTIVYDQSNSFAVGEHGWNVT